MTQDAPLTPNTSLSARRGGTPIALLRVGLYLVLAAVVAFAAFAAYQTLLAKATLTQAQATVVSSVGLIEPVEKHLASGYTDSTGRLLADPPSDPAQLIDPAQLTLAYTADADSETQQVDWTALAAEISKATGKKVVAQPYENTIQDVANVKAGKIQIVALHAADTPYLVNTAGFIPIGVLGGKSGPTGNKLDIAVPVDSPLHTLADLRNHTLTCTVPSSITGYRAAVALLMEEEGLRPNVDYLINFSLGQKKSIKGLLKKQFEAAALSDDKVQTLIANGQLQASDLRIIRQSEVIPRLTIGDIYDLKAELAQSIKQAILQFTNDNGAVDEDGAQPMRFAPVDYKEDFKLVRKIDNAFDPRFNTAAAEKAKKAAAEETPTTAPSAT
jgi:phosphonate transport system substrate-binding protein